MEWVVEVTNMKDSFLFQGGHLQLFYSCLMVQMSSLECRCVQGGISFLLAVCVFWHNNQNTHMSVTNTLWFVLSASFSRPQQQFSTFCSRPFIPLLNSQMPLYSSLCPLTRNLRRVCFLLGCMFVWQPFISEG